ncbi:olfactory receptor 52K2-like [Terrapene carolina triunguis]|uniref:olfactory receptor 52K2-like n=1 Tax=Terrapene triunguis TaxID=2587831 RepID=UPI000E777FE3|nr:olfactory receptor 52K2-like [Terrapene carolina triunguis]XP_026513599.1 olfactory receptor 52K2-like [Terrapene carolina triunguis]
MAASNWTTPHPSTFILLGIPGLEAAHVWISIPFCSVYILSLLGNGLLLAVIKTEPSLHEPMYLFLCMLALADLVVSTTTLPKTLCIFWFRDRAIHTNACLAQIFLIHSVTCMESGFMLAMAFDRYVAVCNPLRHSAILTNRAVAKIGLVIVMRGAIFLGPHPFLLKQLPYCRTHVISHTYCEFMALVKLACEDTTVMSAYSLAVSVFTGGLDFILIVLSYILILRAVFRLPTKEARHKSLSTCSAHVITMLVFYTPATFTYFSHRFGHMAPHVHILIANIYLLFPPMMNPIIYGVRTPGIRRTALHILGIKID